MADLFELQPLTPQLGARVIGLDLAAELSPQAFDALYQAFLRHKVLVFAPLDLHPAAQVALARRFGEVQVHVMSVYHADGFPELYRLSNLDEQGRPSGKHPDKGTMAWHTDGSWQRLTGQATIIYGEQVPPFGGETHFCDMAGAYEWADVVICRAGALTIAELAAAGVASILVPFPHAVDDHQTGNAKFLVNVGGAFLLPQSELTPEAIALIRNYSRSQLLEMAEKARSLAKPDAADAVAQLCTEIAK